MMVVDYGRNEGGIVVQADGIEIKEVPEKKADARQELWDELEEKGIEFKKNMSKSKLEELLVE